MRKLRGPRWEGVRPLVSDRSPVRAFAAAAFAALALSACQDPAGVGLGLIDEEQSDPSVRVVALTDLDTLVFDAPAIGIADVSNSRTQARVLVGDVRDAQFGDARAVGYLDLLQPAAARQLDTDDVQRVWIELPRDYAYGDTTTALPLSLHAIQGSWSADPSYPSDTLFSVGAALATTTVTDADTTLRFDLPASWVTANAATLVGDDFAEGFEGFAIQPQAGYAPAPGLVAGFSTLASASLRLATAEDTLFFALSEVFSSVRASGPTAPPAGVLPARRLSGTAIRFEADLASFGPLPLARGLLTLPLDRSLTQMGSFVRPLPPVAVLYGIRDLDGTPTRTLLGALDITDAGDLAIVDTRTFTSALQQVLLSPATASFDRFEIRPDVTLDSNPASLDVLPIVLPGAGVTSVPRLSLTFVGRPS